MERSQCVTTVITTAITLITANMANSRPTPTIPAAHATFAPGPASTKRFRCTVCGTHGMRSAAITKGAAAAA
jgi:hypothetical protein